MIPPHLRHVLTGGAPYPADVYVPGRDYPVPTLAARAPAFGGEPMLQRLPPLPASQEVCFINGFDPGWGKPPTTYRDVPLSFDADMGAYRFDVRDWQSLGSMATWPVPQWLRRQYDEGLLLQPFKREPGGPWDFRWIPRSRTVTCRRP